MPQRSGDPNLRGPFCLSRAYFLQSLMLQNSQECERPITRMRKLRLRRGRSFIPGQTSQGQPKSYITFLSFSRFHGAHMANSQTSRMFWLFFNISEMTKVWSVAVAPTAIKNHPAVTMSLDLTTETSAEVAYVTSRPKYIIVSARFSSLSLPHHKRLPSWSSRSLGVFDHHNPAAALHRARSLSKE